MRPTLIVLAIAALALPAAAQDRSPSGRQDLADLAYVLGEAHALRQACQGPDDQYWRQRMVRLVQTEQPDAGFERHLREEFNTGFAIRQSQFPACTPASRRAESVAMVRGRALAERLARESRAPADDMAEPGVPR
jgi:uncharacterized protein (TIGR02301 family)